MSAKFEIGKTYLHPGLYTPSWMVLIMARTETTITMRECGFPDDPEDYVTKDIIIENGDEECLAWEYYDHKAYMSSRDVIK